MIPVSDFNDHIRICLMDPKYVDHKNQVYLSDKLSFYRETLIQLQPAIKNLLVSLASFLKKEWIFLEILIMKLIKRSLKKEGLKVRIYFIISW
jgi:hypothetical protein